jgi:hypothetical protein
MSEPFSTEPEQNTRVFIGLPKASVKMRRYAEVYLSHLLRDGPEPPDFKTGHRPPSFSYVRLRIKRIGNGEDT